MSDAPEIHARPKIVGGADQADRGSAAADRMRRLTPTTASRRGCCMSRSAGATSRTRAFARSIAAAARAAPGVVAVFTAEDFDGDVKPVVATSRMANYYATPILPLARGKVRYVGEPVVGVVAESRYLAEDALELIEIDYEPLPVVIDPGAGCASRRAAAARRGRHQRARVPRVQARRCRRGSFRQRQCASAAVSACAARRRSRSSRAPASPNTTRAATR